MLVCVLFFAACGAAKKASKNSTSAKVTSPSEEMNPPNGVNKTTTEDDKKASKTFVAKGSPKPEPTPVPKPIERPFDNNNHVEKAQVILYLYGYEPGRIDGVLKAETTQALHDYQKKSGLPIGDLSNRTFDKLGIGNMDFGVDELQDALLTKGYDPGVVDGLIGPKTRQAFNDFVEARGLAKEGLSENIKTALFSVVPKDSDNTTNTHIALGKKNEEGQNSQVLPNENQTKEVKQQLNKALCDALRRKGYNPGTFAPDLTAPLEDALFRYQVDHDLPLGGLNPETRASLGM